jgi:AraC-like DNA-binding protein
MGIEGIITTLHPAFLYLYIKAVTGQPLNKRHIFTSFWPVPLVSLGFLPYFLISREEKMLVLEGKLFPQSLYPGFVIIALIIVFYFYKCFIALREHKNKYLHIFSYRDNIDLLWLRRILFASLGLFISSFFVGGFLVYFQFSIASTDFIYYATMVGFIFAMGYWGYQQGTIFNIHQPQVPQIEKQGKESNIEKLYEKEVAQLKRVMETEKPYLDPKLTIHQLANQMNLQPHVLSKAIHKHFKKNFFEFINDYRIHHFKKLVNNTKYKGYTILGVALESGFNSKSAFNRIFKEQTGQTPGEFKKGKVD